MDIGVIDNVTIINDQIKIVYPPGEIIPIFLDDFDYVADMGLNISNKELMKPTINNLFIRGLRDLTDFKFDSLFMLN